MKKRKLVAWPILLILSIIIIGVSGFFAFFPMGYNLVMGEGAKVPFYIAYAFNGGAGNNILAFIRSMGGEVLRLFKDFDFTNIIHIVILGILVATAVFIIIQIIVFIKTKKPSMILWVLFTLIFAAGAMMICVGANEYFGIDGQLFIKDGSDLIANGVNGYAKDDINATATILNALTFNAKAFGEGFMPYVIILLVYAFLIGCLLFIVSTIVIYVKSLIYAVSHRHDKLFKNKPELQFAEEGDNFEGEEALGTTNNINTVGNSSPLVVQYINSYGPEAPVPPTQPQETKEGNNNPQVPPYPPFYGYPYPFAYPPFEQKKESETKEQTLTKEDIKTIVTEVLNEHFKEEECDCECGCNCGCHEETNEVQEPEIVEEKSFENEEGEQLEYFDIEDLKTLISNQVKEAITEIEVAKAESKKSDEQEEVSLEPVVAAVSNEESEKEESLSAPSLAHEKATDDTKPETVAPIVVAVPTTLEEEEFEEEDDLEISEEISEEEVRSLIALELKDALKDIKVPVQKKIVKKVITKQIPEEVVVEEVRQVEQEKVEDSKPLIKEEKIEETKEVVKEEKIEEPIVEVKEVVVEEVPQKENKPATVWKNPATYNEVRGKENIIVKGEAIKLNFFERISTGDDILKSNYNSIKNLLMSYGLKDRLSNTGDTFRLHKVTYAKITALGDSLKIYLALDPKDYSSTALPVQDVSKKDAYKDIPLAFKIRSDLSLRRANELILACMRKAGFEPSAEYQTQDYVKEIDDLLEKEKKETSK